MAGHPFPQDNAPTASVAVALEHAERLLARDPRLALEQADAILEVAPRDFHARLIRVRALRATGRLDQAMVALTPLCDAYPFWGAARLELGHLLAARGDDQAALAAYRRAVELDPAQAGAWRPLGDLLALTGDARGAAQAHGEAVAASVTDPRLVEAAVALNEQRLGVAERLLREHLKQQPTDAAAIRMLGELGTRLGRYDDAEHLLARALELAPDFIPARHNYAVVLYRQQKSAEALVEIDRLLASDPDNPSYRNLKAAALSRNGDYAEAIATYEAVLTDFPNQPKGWMSYGHLLKTVGRQADAIGAYRQSIALQPQFGEAWWSLANLKTVHFSTADIDAMTAELATDRPEPEDRFHLHFALGKALEDAGDADASFYHYAQGNALRRQALDYDADDFSAELERTRRLFTKGFFAARAGQGDPSPDPIFIVGLPRAGSTLIEQILASHSAVEGTMELPDIAILARRIGGRKARRRGQSAYPEIVADLAPEQLAALGAEYLARTRPQRRLGRPFFIDKMPNNFQHVGFILAILPNARIIDARRHPLGCCFSAFKQHFARGQDFSYSLADVGRYYADYVRLMAHFDQALPGRIHRVFYEAMVADTEQEVRRLLEYCGLPFEADCLRFYANDRAVRTASSEQVRRPIFTEGVDQWRRYEQWLEPLKTALGPCLTLYPDAPANVD